MTQSQSSKPADVRANQAMVDGAAEPSRGRAIVAGFGLVGRITAERLGAVGVEVTVVELNQETVERQVRLDRPVVFGDVTDPATLEQAGLASADALILTVPDADAAVQTCRIARELNPSVFIAVRTDFVSQGMLAREAGADQVIVEEAVTAEAMQQAVVAQLTK